MTTSSALLPHDVRKVVENRERLEVLERLDVVDTARDHDFDRLTRMATSIFGVKIAIVALVGSDRQWFRSCVGLGDISGTATDVSFCAHTIALPALDDVFVVLDATKDDRFKTNPLVTGWPGIRFYAGAPIMVDNQKIGSLCVIDTAPRTGVQAERLEELRDLGALASTLFALKQEARERTRTAAALLREEWRHALTLEAGKVGSWAWNVDRGRVDVNDMFQRMFALPSASEQSVQDIFLAVHPGDRERLRHSVEAMLDTGEDLDSEARVAADGRWIALRGRVYQRDAAGKPLLMMGASIDITESKRSAEQTHLLLRELNHRVKNTLAMIQSVARQTIRQNPDPQAFINAFSGRLRTISEAHVLLADRDWSYVQLYEVVGAQFGPNFLSKPNRADVRGEDVALPADHALGLGLVLHELTTNAHRHGAWSNDRGVVSLTWDIETKPSRGLRMVWRERGGPRTTHPDDVGLGVRLIERSLAKVLDSKVSLQFDPDGVVAEIWMPLPG